jgi:hypothetical protein
MGHVRLYREPDGKTGSRTPVAIRGERADRRFAASGVGVECRVVRDFSAAEVVTRFASAMVVEPLDGGRADIVTT